VWHISLQTLLAGHLLSAVLNYFEVRKYPAMHELCNMLYKLSGFFISKSDHETIICFINFINLIH